MGYDGTVTLRPKNMDILDYLMKNSLISPDLQIALSSGAQISISQKSLVVRHPNVLEVLAIVSDFVPVLSALRLDGVIVYSDENSPPRYLRRENLEVGTTEGRSKNTRCPMNNTSFSPGKNQIFNNDLDDTLKLAAVLHCPQPTVIVWQDTHLPYLANVAYGQLTQRNPLEWVNDHYNISGWAEGELSRTMDLLEKHQFLPNHEWKIHRRGYGDRVFTWQGSIQLVTLGGRTARITQVLHEA